MKQAKISLAALTIIVSAAAAVAFKPAPNAHRFVTKFFEYGGGTASATAYNDPNNYAIVSGSLGCTSGPTLCQIIATPTTVHGVLPQLPTGFGTAIATLDNNGKTTASPTTYTNNSITVTADFLVP